MSSVSDPLHCDVDPDPDPRIRSEGINLITLFFVISSLLFTYIKKNKWFLIKKKLYILIILFDLYVSLSRFFLLPRSGSTVPEVDLDPAKWYGSDRIRI